MKVKEVIVGTPVILWTLSIVDGKPEPFSTTILSEPWEISLNTIVCRVKDKVSPVEITKLSLRFSISDQWDRFLQESNLVEEKMPIDQRKEMKRAFYAGCGQMLLLVRDDIGDLTRETDMIAAMEDLLRQVTNFWDAQNE